MGAIRFNVALGRAAQYGFSIDNSVLPHDAIVWVLLKSAGLEADPLLRRRTTLADILLGSGATSVEANFTGYARLTHRASIIYNCDQVADQATVNDTTDPSWLPTTAQALGKIVACYDPDTTSGTDADLIPLMADDFVGTTPTSGAILYPVSNNGYFYLAN